jgi:2-oxoglutarate ferredoxin oxidoreductase subunit alpha
VAEQVFTLVAGGKAGAGVRKAGSVAAGLFARMGRSVFQMDDYPSLIRGGHNFCAVSTAVGPLSSHYLEGDLVVCLDQRSVDAHTGHRSRRGVLVHDEKDKGPAGAVALPIAETAKRYSDPELISGVAVAAVLAAAIGLSEADLLDLVRREYRRGVDENSAFARTMFERARPALVGRFFLERGPKERPLVSGNEAIGLGAVAAGLDCLFAYPMTPSSSLLTYLAARAADLGVVVVHPENEIGVINMAIGAAAAGARAMVASSGGGFALMQEALSLAGMAEVPLFCLVSSRPGPSTGMPTYTAQGDLRFILGQGHGEFPRVVASPGTVEEAFLLAGELLNLAWQFQTPAILLTEKHLSESRVTAELEPALAAWAEPALAAAGAYQRYADTSTGVSPLRFPPSAELVKWNSYEHDESGITTEAAEAAAVMMSKRRRKGETLVDRVRAMRAVNVFGDRGPVIITYGSTTMSVREALRYAGLEATVVQPVYLDPLPVWDLARYADHGVTVVEQSSTGLFAELLKEKAGIAAARVIKKYDGRPFLPEDLGPALAEAS